MISYAALILLGKIPLVGFFVSLVVTAVAFGGVVLAIHRGRQDTVAPPVVAPPAAE
jgi:hypothetical protein